MKVEKFEKWPALARHVLALCAVLVGAVTAWAVMSQDVEGLKKDRDIAIQRRSEIQNEVNVLKTGVAVIQTELKFLTKAQRQANEDRKEQYREIIRKLDVRR